ncbi:hypothetical protein JCM8547_005251 [Rhodosporidiobolus lusitaniae]
MSDVLEQFINPDNSVEEPTPPASSSPTFTGVPLFPLPSAQSVDLAPNVKLQPPLSRRGHGPGLVIVIPSPIAPSDEGKDGGSAEQEEQEKMRKLLDPPPLQKWAEEGYAVLQLEVRGVGEEKEGDWGFEKVASEGVKRLLKTRECSSDRVGLIVYEPSLLDQVLLALLSFPNFRCLVTYSSSWEEPSVPTLQLLCTSDPKASGTPAPPPSSSVDGTATPVVFPVTIVTYPVSTPYFFLPDHREAYNGPAAAAAHSKTLEFLKRAEHLDGPQFELEKLWEEHTYYEFTERSVEKKMATTVSDCYVNHVPTCAGGTGRDGLTIFYRDHFIFQNPKETVFTRVSLTKGVDRVVEEFVCSMPHNQTIDWLLPGIPPTGKELHFTIVAIVAFRGDRICHEHIHWDQATVLSQLDLLPSHVPCGSPTELGTSSLVRLPVAGAETAKKALDQKAVESNEMLREGWKGVVDGVE